MAKRKGPGQKMDRAPRTSNTPQEDDEQTRLEVEMASSGRSDVVPPQGLVGAHTARLEPDSAASDEEGEEGDEPTGAGSDVAPTRLAEQRERERHRLERERGRIPAGEGGAIHEKRSPNLTRQDLDDVQREADRRVIGHEIAAKHR
jgi:hypothetical protein